MSKMAPAMVSALIVIGFLAVLFFWLYRPIENHSEGMLTALNILIGSLGTAFSQVVQYWLGSSVGSKQKDDIIKSISST